jgi:predicted lipid-binding transport protein (Tim44 family)
MADHDAPTGHDAPPDQAAPANQAAPADDAAPALPQAPRPILERIGMALIALVLAVLFGVVGVAAFVFGEPFLGVMGVLGMLMVLWVGGMTLFRGR